MSFSPPLSAKILLRVLAAAALIAMFLLTLHWLPGHQVQLHQQHLLKAVEDRNWKKVNAMIGADYRDRWQQNKQAILARMPQAFVDFLACGVEQTESGLTWRNGDAIVRSRLHIVGSGGPIAQFVMQQMETLKEPFTLTWRHESWKPWDWRLVAVDQPEIAVPEDPEL